MAKYRVTNKNILYVSRSDIIYDYFFADVILVVEGGTALVESFINNPIKTILIDWYNDNQKDMFKLKNLNLIRAVDCIDLLNKILYRFKICDNVNENDKIIHLIGEEAKNYLNIILGYKINLISDKLINYMLKN